MQQKEAFIQTIKDNEGIIYKITRVYAKDTEDQKDLYQEIVYQLWKSFDSFKGKSKLSTWMYRVALNTSIAHLNQNKRTVFWKRRIGFPRCYSENILTSSSETVSLKCCAFSV